MLTGSLKNTHKSPVHSQIMDENEIITLKQISVPVNSFWSAIHLWQQRPHIINRRLCSSTNIITLKITVSEIKLEELIGDIYNMNEKVIKTDNESVFKLIKQMPYVKSVESIDLENMQTYSEGIFLCFNLLLPKSSLAKQCIEVNFLNKLTGDAVWIPLKSDHNEIQNISITFPYGFKYNAAEIKMWVQNSKNAVLKSVQWLEEKLFPKIIKWAEECEVYDYHSIQSLSLISVENYFCLYHELKKKYANDIIKIWPENTDPLKFVHEDVAIASYLITLWRKEFKDKGLIQNQRFVDLGCGNGLLVYILTQEGYFGYGIDVRKRKIWDMFPKNTKLEISSIVPSNQTIYPDVDWLIGNHSDELTPWIPVIAARSSVSCRYFVLPCCAYEFNGKKYQRADSSQSIYSDYIKYVQKISEVCGFETFVDKLRIPSTKRTCIIGMNRISNADDIQEFINIRCQDKFESNEDKWSKDFQARPNIESVRNCTQIDREVTQNIVKKVVKVILERKNNITNMYSHWNIGGTVEIKELAKMIPDIQLRVLKKECGGLQTLLKNHHYIFKVSNGTVQLRVPASVNDKPKYLKKKQCWFQLNHPNGCPHSDDNCSYIHS